MHSTSIDLDIFRYVPKLTHRSKSSISPDFPFKLPVEIWEKIIEDNDFSAQELRDIRLVKPFSTLASRVLFRHIAAQSTFGKTMKLLKALDQDVDNIRPYVRSLALYFGPVISRKNSGTQCSDEKMRRYFRNQTGLVNRVLRNLPNLRILRLDIPDPMSRGDELLRQCLQDCVFPHLESFTTSFDIGPGLVSFLLDRPENGSIGRRLSTLHLDSSSYLPTLDLTTFQHTFSSLTHLGWSHETPPTVINAIARACTVNGSKITEITLSQSLSYTQWRGPNEAVWAYRMARDDYQDMLDVIKDVPGLRENVVSLNLNFPLVVIHCHEIISATFSQVRNLWVTDVACMGGFNDGRCIHPSEASEGVFLCYRDDFGYRNLENLVLSKYRARSGWWINSEGGVV